MKTCPNCGSVLADMEPYCENCGFDPDFDGGSWNKSYGSARMPYIHGEHIKSSQNSGNDVLNIIAGFLLLGSLVAAAFVSLDMYHWDIVSLVMSNFGPLVLLIIIVAVFIKAYLFFDSL